MKLLRLKLENWRGITAQEINFGDGVTVIEGPNEIGKSSLIEALFLLFNELDSTSKATVKAVQPVGQDVASNVELEFTTGDFHAVYSKVFNKKSGTILEISLPSRESLTGREAHQRVDEILDSTIDKNLWGALQVTQGTAISQALLQDKQGLSKALDAAAGENTGEEDSALFERVVKEYEAYFTLKAGKSRITSDEKQLVTLEVERDACQVAIDDVAKDIARYESLETEQTRLKGDLPGFKQTFDALTQQLQALDQLVSKRDATEALLDVSKQQLSSVQSDLESRTRLDDAIKAVNQQLTDQRQEMVNVTAQINTLMEKKRNSETAVKSAKKLVEAAEKDQRSTEAQLAIINDRDQFESLKQQLSSIETLEEQIQEHTDKKSKANIIRAQYQQLLQADADWRHARGLLDAGAPEVRVTALADNSVVTINADETASLQSGEIVSRTAIQDISIEIDHIARVDVIPGSSLSDLQDNEQISSKALAALMIKMGVDDLSDAARRLEIVEQSDMALMERIPKRDALLGGESKEMLMGNINALSDRLPDEIPGENIDLQSVTRAFELSKKALIEAEASVERTRVVLNEDNELLNATKLRRAEMEGLLNTEQGKIEVRQSELESLRSKLPDAALAKNRTKLSSEIEVLNKKLTEQDAEFKAMDPEYLHIAHENAQNTWQGKEQRLKEITRDLDRLAGGLEQSQAMGLFEKLNTAETAVVAQEDKVTGLQRRAAAAKYLYDTLNRHREESRRAYVKPLKTQIDSLGRFVFGDSFKVDVDEDLSIIARELDGKIIPYDDLSVGAKEQLGILTRVAAARLVASQEGVPLILDDTLGYADPGRLNNMGLALAVAGKETQIIILTCTPGRFGNVGNATVVHMDVA